mmetsp:Transcript_59936/g.95185  ORF Transcript_59936/g.95185 Transcript_59936/m.95185 type:complete len:255 (+) Transcript_59936:613-1377(+)
MPLCLVSIFIDILTLRGAVVVRILLHEHLANVAAVLFLWLWCCGLLFPLFSPSVVFEYRPERNLIFVQHQQHLRLAHLLLGKVTLPSEYARLYLLAQHETGHVCGGVGSNKCLFRLWRKTSPPRKAARRCRRCTTLLLRLHAENSLATLQADPEEIEKHFFRCPVEVRPTENVLYRIHPVCKRKRRSATICLAIHGEHCRSMRESRATLPINIKFWLLGLPLSWCSVRATGSHWHWRRQTRSCHLIAAPSARRR